MVINMLSCTFNIYFLVATLCVFMCQGNSNIKICDEKDERALLKLKVGFINDSGILSSWKLEADCCNWNGISCNHLTGHVTKLQVQTNDSRYLGGKIDSSLCDLQHLTHLNLGLNDFGGSKIPKCIGSLNQLRELNLSHAYLVGAIPNELRNLSNLQTLDLGNNYGLIAYDLEWISNLSSLRHLDLSGVNLSQAIDWQSSISKKALQLRKVILAYADLAGIFPHQIGNLSNLELLDLGGNDLIAKDLEWVSHFSSLRHLYLSGVNLSQAFDWQSSLSKMSSLHELNLDGCALPQVSPKSFLHNNYSTSLTSLTLAQNHLDTSVLHWVSNICKTLVEIDLSGNSFQHIPAGAFSNMNYLKSLDLSDTSLQHVASDAFTNTTSLESLDLSVNSFQHIPAGTFSNMNSLKSLDLSQTSLQHVASDAFTNTTSLESLDLSFNNLDNDVVKAISNSCQLRELYLLCNNLYGPVSDWIPQLYCAQYSMETLELTYNPVRREQLATPDNPFRSGPFPDFSNFSSLVSLFLPNANLNGPIQQALGYLLHLSELDISHNNLSGPIPQLLGYLLHLSKLDISYNNMSGPIPQSLGYLLHLSELDISYNNLSGPIPQSLGYLLHLSELDISYNNLSGPIPQSLGYLSNISRMDISHNSLSGPFPKLHEASLLEELRVSDNKLNGVVNEEHLSILSNLRILDVSNNFLSFKISPKWVPPFQLDMFFARSCNFSGGFPLWLKHQEKLEYLDISNGSISDSIPEWILALPYMEYLNISHNKIRGKLPRSLQSTDDFIDFIVWDFSFNNLSGPIPHFPRKTLGMFLSNNRFSGSISFLCVTLDYQLEYLDMSSNLLSGKLPHCWRKFSSLTVLALANNNFSGAIPSSLSYLEYIETIHLNNNNFSGKIPTLMNSQYLKFIDYGQNNLNGKLPTWIGHYSPKLIVLRLQANRFHGNIPTSLCKLSLLQVLDLSQNNISGTIPYCLNNLIALSNLTFPRDIISYRIFGFSFYFASLIENAMLNWKGEYIKYDKNLGLMTSIDLSSNHLTGEIPSSIVSLVALASLNLSRNNLTRFIPKNMGQMKMLESLDLSSNSLSSGIPMSFSNLNFLSFLNLSFNNLSGEIPQTTQLQTFTASSYIGNHGLYGQPLTKGCPKNYDIDQNHKTSSNIDANEGDELISFGFYISMIFGFFVGFWGVCGTLIHKSSWRAAYFQFFTNMYDWIYVRMAIFKARMKRFQG